jgi:hypothetical protein
MDVLLAADGWSVQACKAGIVHASATVVSS